MFYERRKAMKKTIRCCISCILPCGVLDVVRIVHASGRVDELTGAVTAGEILKAYPKHVLKRPSSASEDGVVPKIVVVPPEAELRKGKIYFLMPAPAPEKKPARRKKRRDTSSAQQQHHRNEAAEKVVGSDRYVSEIMSEKVSPAPEKDRRRGRVAVWRPHLESIMETPSEVIM